MPQVKVTREEWLFAALAALAASGVSGVAVDPLAKKLGVTRGSFYWHFKDRAALLKEALLLWEEQSTVGFIAGLSDIVDPRTRLEALFYGALTDDTVAGLEPAIVAHAQHPVVGAVLARVTERRLDHLTSLFAEVGLDAAAARRQAVATYAAYLGWIELRRAAPGIVPETAASRESPAAEALAHLLVMLTPRD
ncbi:TetR family transcriptional regulator [Nocardioides sp. LHD-245]|uniref:TetR/AcrR family transcriptional regulator n=1 Tax=Nocardioides sp. LHD-245 TaxID=3051387 RepID=UPI0027DFCE80|nr:TetR family transcriptional regulator [Nocardioides sp. LHD-245]